MFSSIHYDYPIDFGSKKRIYNMGKIFQSLGHAVHFVYLPDEKHTIESLQFMMKGWDSFTLIEKKNHTQMSVGNNILDECYENYIAEKVSQVVNIYDIDLVWCNYIFYSKFLESLPPDIYKVIDTPEVFKDKYMIFETENGNNYSWYSYSGEDEAKALDRADLVIAITQKDADYFASVCDAKIETIGHLELEKFSKKAYGKLKKIGFLGGNHAGNTMAINAFLDHFYKHSELQEKIEVVVAGTVCNAIKYNHKNLTLLGKINKLEDFYYDIDLVISPVYAGTGQKIKSIEALAYGIPIVSTIEGFTGIESREPCHNLESIAKVVSCVESLYESPEEVSRLALKSQKLLIEYNEKNLSTLTRILNKAKENNYGKSMGLKQILKKKILWIKNILIKNG